MKIVCRLGHRAFLGVAAVLCATALVVPAGAALITIRNASFEKSTGYWEATGGASDWVTYDYNESVGDPGSGVNMNEQVVEGSGTFSGFDGTNVCNVYLGLNEGSWKGTAWMPAIGLGNYAANTLYTLTVAAATTDSFATSRDALVALATNGNDIASIVASNRLGFGSLSTTFKDMVTTLDTSLRPDVVGAPIVVMLAQDSPTGSQYGRTVTYDNVRLDASPIPEPATGAMLVGALVTGALLRRRRV
jgi:hypothetical protein